MNWVGNTIDAQNSVKTKGAAQMLVKCHLGVIRDTITELGIRYHCAICQQLEQRMLGHREICQLLNRNTSILNEVLLPTA